MNRPDDKITSIEHDSLKAHYDFDYRKAKPNRFAARIQEESLMVVLEPDVAAFFPTSEAVNQALRVLAAVVQNLPATKPAKRRKQRTPSVTAVQS